MERKLYEKLAAYLKEGRPVALVTVTNMLGSTPRGVGSTMIVDEEGELLAGTVGGGSVEQKAKADAKKCLQEGVSKQVHYELNMKESEDSLHMLCGGAADLFIQVFSGQRELVIVGAGHIGKALANMAGQLGFRLVIMDSRPAYANQERFPGADLLLPGPLEESLGSYAFSDKSNVVIVTHGHLEDHRALRLVLGKPCAYIGMIGSRTKVRKTFSQFEEEGFSKEDLMKVHAPMGLDIGGETPEEIALSILAEIQAVYHGKDGRALKEKRGF